MGGIFDDILSVTILIWKIIYIYKKSQKFAISNVLYKIVTEKNIENSSC